MNKNKFLNFAIILVLVYFVMNFFNSNNTAQSPVLGDFIMTTTKQEYDQNDLVAVKIKNNTTGIVTIKNECPQEPLDVKMLVNNEWQSQTKQAEIKCDDTTDIMIKPQEEVVIDYSSWNHELFGTLGRYKISATLNLAQQSAEANTQTLTQNTTQQTTTTTKPSSSTTKIIESNEFTVKPQGLIGTVWKTLFYQPLYNILIFLVANLPYNDLGLAIILLTIIIRTILLIPSQKALKSQRKLQEIQPKLAKLREKHKDNQEMIAKETMLIWKEHKVNPLGSCLPLLIQFPVLIALFYVIQSGLNPDNAYLLYEPLKNFSLLQINVNFFGIQNLTHVNHFVLPLIVGALQFLQMKLALVKSTKTKQPEKKDKKSKGEMEIANQMMTYVMPVMIALFTASVPAGVGLYWSISTLYGIIQQLVVNKEVAMDKTKVRILPANKSNS